MSQEALTTLLQCLDSMHSISLTKDDLDSWIEDEVRVLKCSGILKEAGNTDCVRCDGCDDGCLADVEIIDGPDGSESRAYIYCSEREDVARVEVALERLKLWSISTSGVVGKLQELSGCMSLEELVDDRFWWFGQPGDGAQRRDYFFARGATWSDAREIFPRSGRLRECNSAVVFVPSNVPEDGFFGPSVNVASLARLLRVNDSSLCLDPSELDRLWEPRTVCGMPKDVFDPGRDYRTPRYHGKVYELSPTQAKIIRALHKAWLSGNPDMTIKAIQLQVKEAPTKMSTIFRSNDDRRVLIKRIKLDIYRLNVPDPAPSKRD